MDDKLKILARTLGEERVGWAVNLADHTVTRTPGVAQTFYTATSTRELIRAIETCRELKINFLVLGAGSKVSLKEVKGLVVKNRSDKIRIFGIKGKVSRDGLGIEEALVETDSGVTLHMLVDYANNQGLGGLEVFREMPGTVGGSLYFNPTLRQKLHQVEVLTTLGVQKIKLAEQLKKEDIILSAVFKLKSKKA